MLWQRNPKDVPRVTTERVSKVQDEDVPRVTAESVPKVQEEDVPRITTESVPQAKSEDFQPVPLPRLGTASDDPASTSSIDHLTVAPGQLVCPDQDSLAAAFVAGVMLGSNPERIAKFGCKTIPTDAQVEILHRFPSGLQFLRVVKVNVTSPSQRIRRSATQSRLAARKPPRCFESGLLPTGGSISGVRGSKR